MRLELPIAMHIYIYIYIYICVCVYTFINMNNLINNDAIIKMSKPNTVNKMYYAKYKFGFYDIPDHVPITFTI